MIVMNKKLQASVIALLLLGSIFLFSGSSLAGGTSAYNSGFSPNSSNSSTPVNQSPLSPAFYIPIKLSNNHSYFTPQNFTQRIYMDWSVFASYLNKNVSNVRFYDSLAFISQNELYGWIESANTTTATSSLIYINMLDYLIPSDSSTTIYMVFMQKNASWGDHWGLNPMLSGTYGQFDNGKYVFSNYFNALASYSDFSGVSGGPGGTITRGNQTYNGRVIPILNITGSLEYTAQSFQSQYFTEESSFYFNQSYAQGQTGVSGQSTAYTITQPSADHPNFGIMPAFKSATAISEDDPGTLPVSTGLAYAEENYYSNATSNLVNARLSSQPYTGGVLLGDAADTISGTEHMVFSYSFGLTSNLTPINWAFISPTTPDKAMPTPTLGSVAIPIYPVSFTSYGLPSGASWTVAIGFGSGNNVEQISSVSPTIFSYLPNGTYTFTIGSLTNGSYQSGFDKNLTPSPSGGQLIVTGSHTNQVVIWNKADLLMYNLIPGTASLSKGRIIIPIFVVNSNNIPANNTTIKQIWTHLKLSYVSVNSSENAQIPFVFSSSGYGEFSIFVNLTAYQIVNITHTNATVSMVSPFNKTSGYTDLAVGSLGPTAFANSNFGTVINPQKQSQTGFTLTLLDKKIIAGFIIAIFLLVLVILYEEEIWRKKGGGKI